VSDFRGVPFLLLLVPLVDVVLLFVAARHVGGWPVLGFVVASAVVGGWLARRSGRRIAAGVMEARRSGRPPQEGMAHAALATAAGGLLAWPGPLTTLAGLALLAPPVRKLLALAASRFVERRLAGVMTVVAPPDDRPRRDVIDV
jgi:UPF0716 protein FxsA